MSRFKHNKPTDKEEARLVREDRAWKNISIFAALLGFVLILTAVIAATVNPTLAIAIIVSSFITVCFPVLAFLQRDASWKRLEAYREQRSQEKQLKDVFMEMPDNEEFKIRALQANLTQSRDTCKNRT